MSDMTRAEFEQLLREDREKIRLLVEPLVDAVRILTQRIDANLPLLRQAGNDVALKLEAERIETQRTRMLERRAAGDWGRGRPASLGSGGSIGEVSR